MLMWFPFQHLYSLYRPRGLGPSLRSLTMGTSQAQALESPLCYHVQNPGTLDDKGCHHALNTQRYTEDAIP